MITDYFIVFGIAFLVVFLLREYFTFKNNLTMKYILTPLVTSLIIGFVVLSIANGGINRYRTLVLVALILSLIADVLLMIVEIDLLKYGIVYFLSAHIVYVFAFSTGYEFQTWNIAVMLFFIAAAILYYKSVGSEAGKLKIPVLVYSFVLSIMVFFSVTSLNNGLISSSVFLASGGILFAVSDTCLGINAFKKPIPHSSVITWSTYGPAQLLFALSCF